MSDTSLEGLFPKITAPLQPLRIEPGWTISYNEFLEADLDTDENPNTWAMRKQDLFQATQKKRNRLLDLGWYPEQEVDGAFRLQVYEGDFTGTQLHEFSSRNRLEVVAEMERLFLLINRGDL